MIYYYIKKYTPNRKEARAEIFLLQVVFSDFNKTRYKTECEIKGREYCAYNNIATDSTGLHNL